MKGDIIIINNSAFEILEEDRDGFPREVLISSAHAANIAFPKLPLCVEYKRTLFRMTEAGQIVTAHNLN